MRELSTDERFSQMVTQQSQHDFFVSHNTGTFPVYEKDYVTKIHPIRYGGSMNMPNTFRL